MQMAESPQTEKSRFAPIFYGCGIPSLIVYTVVGLFCVEMLVFSGFHTTPQQWYTEV